MTRKRFAAFWITFGSLVFMLGVVPAHGEQAGSGAETVRTADGRPDLGGVWDFRTLTPLQRPEDQIESMLTDEQAAEVEASAVQRAVEADRPSEIRTEPLPVLSLIHI